MSAHREKTIQHIRMPLPPRGGNSFYRDKRDFLTTATYCGAEITCYDVNARDVNTKTARVFYANTDAVFAVCDSCKTAAGVL